MKAILGLLALLAVASTASATYAPWYYHTLYKTKCYVPGCDQCAAYKPYTCEKCAAGYALQKDNTCGCAAGFGSYVQPPMSGYPWYPPHSCPTWTLSKTGARTGANMRTTLSSGAAGRAVSLKTWYSTKPDFCTQTYLPTKTCQGSIPVPSVGYCQCFACPAGTNSTGGPIASAGAACTPNAQPVVRCVQAPPAIPNANPWSSKCRLLRTSKACTTTCAAGFQPQPAGSALTAKCTAGGVWQITGSCVSAAATCKGSPSAGANANPFTNCADGADGATCTSSCVTGFEGTVTATCNAAANKWVVTNTCKKVVAVTCAGTPASEGADFSGCTDLAAGATCDGVCLDGSSIVATCGNNGQYTIDGTCPPAGPACPGAPEVPENGLPFGENQEGATCEEGKLDDACTADCKEGFIGDVSAVCTAVGWDVTDNCVEDGGDYPAATCEGLPEDAVDFFANPWPETCAGMAAGETCEGSCATGPEGTAFSFCTDAGVWENSINCDPAGRKGNKAQTPAKP